MWAEVIVASRRTASLFALMDGLMDSGVPGRDSMRAHPDYVFGTLTLCRPESTAVQGYFKARHPRCV
jgi:hypothetical protein